MKTLNVLNLMSKTIAKPLLLGLFSLFITVSHASVGLFAGDSLAVGYHMFSGNKQDISVAKTSAGLLSPRFYDIPASIRNACKVYKPDFVVISVGTNDVKPINGNAVGSVQWANHYSARVDDLISAARACHSPIVLVLPLPYTGSLENGAKSVRSVLQNYCTNDVLCLQPLNEYNDYAIIDEKRTLIRSKDRVHMTGAGYRYIAKEVRKKVQK